MVLGVPIAHRRKRVGAAGLQFLSRILPLEAEGMDVLHCAASRALALQQGYRLAQIAEEIHAPDPAAQDTGEGGKKSMMMTQLIAKVPFPGCAQVCVLFLRCL